MNSTSQPETNIRTLGNWNRLAWLPIPLLLAAIIVARIAGLHDSYEYDTLRLVLSVTFYTLVSLGTLYLIGRSFLASGSPGMLLLECGVLLWSLAGTVGDFVSHGDANIDVAVFNIGILLAGMCHLAGAILAPRPLRVLRAKPVWLAVGCAFALGALWLVAKATVSGWLPVFFIPGHGGTPVRYCVLIAAIAMFVLSAGLLKVSQRTARLPFTSWYILALLLLAVGLFGIMIQLSLGSVVNWLSRTAQWVGGLYLLFAALASLRESNLPLLPAENKSHPVYYRGASTIAIVLAAAAIRLTFLQALGMKAPFVTFYPAVIFAALYGGWRGGLLATVLSAIFVDYFWIEPVNHLNIGQPSDWLVMMSFLFGGAMITWVIDSMLRARARANVAETQALLAAEREAASEALRENESRLRLAQESANVGIWDWMVETGELNFTPELNKLYGLPSGTIKTYQDWRDRVHPDDIGRIEAGRDEAIAKHESFDLEFRGRHSSGEYRWISTNGGAIFNEAGKAIRVFGVNIDITERKRAEEALRRYANIIKLSFDAIIVWRPDVGIMSWNRGAEKMYGFTENEALGKITHNLLSTIHPEPWVQIESCLREKNRWEGELRHLTKDGREIIVSARLQLILGDDGVELVLETNRDITERKRTEEALQESERRERERAEEMAALFEAIPMPVFIARDPDCLHLTGNRLAAEILRIPQGNELSLSGPVETRPHHFRPYKDGRELMLDELPAQRAAHGNSVKDFEFSLIFEDGVIRHVLGYGTPLLDNQGCPRGTVAVLMDITDRKRAEEALRESEHRERERSAELATVLDAVPTPVFVANDPECLHLTGNRAADELLHNPRGAEASLSAPADVRPRHFRALKDGRELALEELPAQRAACGVCVEDFEFSIVFDDGTTRHVLGYGTPLYDDENQPRGAVHVLVDITERKQAEEALRAAQSEAERYGAEMAALMDAVPAAVFIAHDVECMHMSGSRVTQELLKLPPTANFSKSAPPSERPVNFRPMKKGREIPADQLPVQMAACGREVRDYEFDLVFADGTVCTMLGNAVPLQDKCGQPLGAIGAFIEITKRKRAEEALRDSEAKYRDLFTNMTEEVHFWELVRDEYGRIKTWRFVDANPPTLKSWGKTIDEIMGKTTDEIFGPGASDHYMPVVQKIITEGVPHTFEDYFPNLDRYFRFTSVPLGDHFITTGADITSIKKAELDLQKAHDELAIQVEERTRELREKEVLLKEVHHRVKNNLQVISSLVSLQSDNSKDETVREVLRDVTYRVRTMALVHEKLYQSSDLASIDFAEYTRSLLGYLCALPRGCRCKCPVET
jgi:PAS domain S-box-containing protein